MILHIDWRSWRKLPLSHRTRHVYLNLVVLTTTVPNKPVDAFRKKLKLKAGQWHAMKAELRYARLLAGSKLVVHGSVLLTQEAEGREQSRD